MRRSRRFPTLSSLPAIRRRCARRGAATSSPPAASSNPRASSGAGASSRLRSRPCNVCCATKRRARVLYVVLAVAVAAYGTLVGALYVFQRNLLYFPIGSRPELGALAELGVREIELRTGDGLSLLAWYSAPSGDRPTVAYFHGNGGHVGHRADRVPG